ncbi:hypothetical protein DFH09DRAFT_1328502 [Mycena vulgaris]|nr:hypothetical protein DFH09DRAFT_1328502 [Mycena vulgaris]
MAQGTPAYEWLWERIPRPHWGKCPKGGRHTATIYQALNRPAQPHRFGEYSFFCTKGCTKNPIIPIVGEEQRLLQIDFMVWRAQDKLTRAAEKALARAQERLADAQAGIPPPVPKPRKRKEPEAPVPPATSARPQITLVAAPSSGTSRSKAKAKAPPQPTQPDPKSKGKGKAKANTPAKTPEPDMRLYQAEDDEYDSDSYEIHDDQRRRVEVIIYTEPDGDPIQQTLNLRAVQHFDFNYFRIAKTVNAVSETDSGLPFNSYVWYCVLQNKWLSVSSPINLQPRGAFLVCRQAALAVDQCPDLLDWVELAIQSVLALAGDFNSSDDEGDDEYTIVSDSDSGAPTSSPSITSSPRTCSSITSSPVAGPSSSAPAASSRSSTVKQSSPLKRKLETSSINDEDDVEEEPLRRSRRRANPSGKDKQI